MADAPILVASDLSARSDRAVDRAIRLGKQMHCPVKLVHVRQEPGKVPQADIEALVRATLPEPDLAIDILLPAGSPPKAIARTIEETGALLAVVGAARFNHLSDFFLGTAVDYIVRRSPVPVLVVKQRAHFAYRRILVPVDFSAWSKNALLTAATLFPEAELNVLHAFHVPYEGLQRDPHVRSQTMEMNEQALEKFLSDPGLPADLQGRIRRHLEYGDIGKVLGDAIRKLKPDLVALGTHGTGGFRQATIGSIAASLLEWISPDTLMVPLRQG